jgi:hypothetical protein
VSRRRNSGGGFVIGFAIIWVLALVASLSFLGVVIWAIIQVVNHYT